MGGPIAGIPSRPLPSRHGRRAVLAAVALAAVARGSVVRATTGKATVETILTVPITAPAPPDPPYPGFGIEPMTLEPGSVEPYGKAEFHGVGDIGFVVDRGEISFEVDGPALVARKGGNVIANGIPVAAGSVTVLRPGDQGFTASGVVSRRRSTGKVQAQTFEVSATDYGYIDSDHDGVSFYDPAATAFPLTFKGGAPARHAVSTLLRVKLTPDEQIRLGDLAGAELLAVLDGTLNLYKGGNPLVASGLGAAPKPMTRVPSMSGMASLSSMFDPSTILRSDTDSTATVLVATLGPATAPSPGS